jgi:hypothetical protein
VAAGLKLTPLGASIVAIGGLESILMIPREVFKAAILANASGVMVAHNHPSGGSTRPRQLRSGTEPARDPRGGDRVAHLVASCVPRYRDERRRSPVRSQLASESRDALSTTFGRSSSSSRRRLHLHAEGAIERDALSSELGLSRASHAKSVFNSFPLAFSPQLSAISLQRSAFPRLLGADS